MYIGKCGMNRLMVLRSFEFKSNVLCVPVEVNYVLIEHQDVHWKMWYESPDGIAFIQICILLFVLLYVNIL